MRKHLLTSTAGDLGSFNEVSRIGELAKGFQFRSAFNYSKVKLAADDSVASLDFSDPAHTTEDGLPGPRKTMKAPAATAALETRREFYYRASQVVTGAVFDILVEIFQAILVAKKLIPAQLADAAEATWDSDPKAGTAERRALAKKAADIHAGFARAFRGRDKEFDDALCAARDYVGRLLAAHWLALSPNKLNFRKLARGLKAACAKIERDGLPAGVDPAATVARCFSWRGIAI